MVPPRFTRFICVGIAFSVACALAACGPSRPRSCDVTAAACTVHVGGEGAAGTDLHFDLGVRPLSAGVPVEIKLGAGPRVTDVSVSLTEPTQMMVPTKARLRSADGGYAGHVSLPVCVAHRMDWQLVLSFKLDGLPQNENFTFTTYRNNRLQEGNPVVAEVEDIVGSAPVDFTLTSADRVFRLSDLRGKLVILSFGFASCPDICPTQLASLGSALRALTPEERDQVRVVFVSVDPARDSAESLRTYGAHFHEHIIGVTGTDEEVAAAAAVFRVFYARSGDDIDHSSFTSVVDRSGRLVARMPHNAGIDLVHRTVRQHLPVPPAPVPAPPVPGASP